MAESTGEANVTPSIPRHQFDGFQRVNEALVYLMKLEAGAIQTLFQETMWCPTLSVAIVLVIIYFIAMLCFDNFSANCSQHGRMISEKFIWFLGALADILLLLIISPAFGWFTLIAWAIVFIVFVKYYHRMIAQFDFRFILSALISFMGNQSLANGRDEDDPAPVPSHCSC